MDPNGPALDTAPFSTHSQTPNSKNRLLANQMSGSGKSIFHSASPLPSAAPCVLAAPQCGSAIRRERDPSFFLRTLASPPDPANEKSVQLHAAFHVSLQAPLPCQLPKAACAGAAAACAPSARPFRRNFRDPALPVPLPPPHPHQRPPGPSPARRNEVIVSRHEQPQGCVIDDHSHSARWDLKWKTRVLGCQCLARAACELR